MIRVLNAARMTTLLAAGVVLVVAGCGKSGPETAKIRGTVTLDGNPLADAGVAFSTESGQMASAQTDASGNFTIEAPLGKNAVTVTKTAGGGADAGDGLMPAEDAAAPPPKSQVPDKYSNPKTSGLSVDVAKGMDPVKLELSSR